MAETQKAVQKSKRILMKSSALQRAENSSISAAARRIALPANVSVLFSEPKIPQCDQRFNRGLNELRFQCSSASRKFLNLQQRRGLRRFRRVSVLFSEPKIPQCLRGAEGARDAAVSVLFSEPKIPQSTSIVASSRERGVSVLFSEPKIPQSR